MGYWHQLGSLARTTGVNFGVPHPSHKIFPARCFFFQNPALTLPRILEPCHGNQGQDLGNRRPNGSIEYISADVAPRGVCCNLDWQWLAGFSWFFHHIWRSELWHFWGSDVFIHMLSLSQTRTHFLGVESTGRWNLGWLECCWSFFGPVKTCKSRDAMRIHYSVSPQTPTNRTSQNHRWNLT